MIRRRSSSTPRLPLERPGFTPSQIIGLVLAVGLVVLALPVAVEAAGTLVTIQDSSTTRKARVDAATSGLRVGGITNIVLDQAGAMPAPGSVSYEFNSAPYSQIRIFADTPSCGGCTPTLTVECLEGTTRTCLLVSAQSFDSSGYGAVFEVPGRTVRVTVNVTAQFGSTWHVVAYGHAP